MNNKLQNTDEILSAIRNMMSDEENNNEQPLPKDVLELTQSVEQKKDAVNHEEVLELTEFVSEDNPITRLENVGNKNIPLGTEVDEIRLLVRESIKNHSSEKIDTIIKQEMKKIIEEKLSQAKVIIDSGNKN
ncbi:MAG: hypothetical protein CMD43_01280 [Gammaproteobacteria bacterium]|nr:hypothetical protein [Gammaproteobacteria bacterium]|tara:strand:- start:179 stop:574 length:396 start_codon:yes stop_codon:yes gene_type:complete